MKNVNRKLHTLDAEGQSVGRLASRIAGILQGKHKPEYVPYLDLGDAVRVINMSKIKLTGRKPEQKMYFRVSGYLGGLKRIPVGRLMHQNPAEILRHAVRLMLPKNKLRQGRMKRLNIE